MAQSGDFVGFRLRKDWLLAFRIVLPAIAGLCRMEARKTALPALIREME